VNILSSLHVALSGHAWRMTAHARAEAEARLGGRYDARVLEPSPPVVGDPPWFADDPLGRGEPSDGRPRVSPVSGAQLRWDELIDENPDLAPWCAERWLGVYRRLQPAPAALTDTREALHRLAEVVVSPARAQANGKIGLRFCRGGFGTPFFGEEVQLRVAGKHLIVQTREGERVAPITTLAERVRTGARAMVPRRVTSCMPSPICT
jgi:hypothetical protein